MTEDRLVSTHVVAMSLPRTSLADYECMLSKIFVSYSTMNQADEMTCIPFAFALQ